MSTHPLGISPTLHAVSLMISVGLFLLIIELIRKDKIDLNYSMIWPVILTSFLLFTFFPSFLYRLTTLLGIQTPVNTLFFFGILFSIVFLIGLTLIITKLSRQVRRLVQLSALLQSRIEDLEASAGEAEKKKSGNFLTQKKHHQTIEEERNL